MNAGQLKAMLQEVPDDTPLMKADNDHAMSLAYVAYSHVQRDAWGNNWEYFGPEHLESGDTVIRALIVD